MKKLLIALVALSFVTGCKKDDDNNNANVDDGAKGFVPLTTGTNWTYNTSTTQSGNTTTSTVTLTVLNGDTTINGRAYKRLASSTGGNNYWTRGTGADINNYYRYGLFPGVTASGGFSFSNFEELYLRTNYNVNDTWTGDNIMAVANGSNYTITPKYKIVAKDQNRTVGSTNFTKVTQVHLDLTTTVFGFTVTVGTGEFYYASGVGMIEFSANLGGGLPGVTATDFSWKIQSYTIK